MSVGGSVSSRRSTARGTGSATSGKSGSGLDGEGGQAAGSADGKKCPQVGEGGSVHWWSCGEAVRAGEGEAERARFVRTFGGGAAGGDPEAEGRGDLEMVPAVKAMRCTRYRRFAEAESAGLVGVGAPWSPKRNGEGLSSAVK